MSNEIAAKKTFSLAPANLQEAMQFADLLSKSDMVPKDYQGKPANILVAVQWGGEIGLHPLQALQGIAVINGRPALWGDAMLALVLSSPACKDVIERYEGEGDDYAAVCIAQRHGREDKISRFSLKQAKAAGLLGKTGTWTSYRDRMLQMRARGFALRDQFADVIKGMALAEEVGDYVDADFAPARPTALQIANAARIAPTGGTDDERAALVADLEKIAATGLQALERKWADIGKDGRKMVGAQDWTRIKGLVPAPIISTVEPAQDGPSYAQLMQRVHGAKTADDLEQVRADCGHLPQDQQSEILTAIDAKEDGSV